MNIENEERKEGNEREEDVQLPEQSQEELEESAPSKTNFIKKVLKNWNWFEIIFLFFSIVLITVCFAIGEDKNPLSYICSIIGVTSVLMVAKYCLLCTLYYRFNHAKILWRSDYICCNNASFKYFHNFFLV